MEIFPAAKCIFHEREAEAWFVSFKNQVDKICERKKLPDALQRILIRILSPKMYRYTLMLEKNIAGHFFSKKQGFRNWDLSQPEVDEMVCKKNYRMHCADFMRNCPVEKRLVLERLDCGWEVVCDFVGKDVPDVVGGFEKTSLNHRT